MIFAVYLSVVINSELLCFSFIRLAVCDSFGGNLTCQIEAAGARYLSHGLYLRKYDMHSYDH